MNIAMNFASDARKNMSELGQYGFSFIIFMAGNAAVPKITQSLENKKDIVMVVNASYIFVSIFYSFIAVIGYWLYGKYTDVMIINDFFIWPGGYVVDAVSILMILNLWSSFAIVLNLLADVVESLIDMNDDTHVACRRLLRMFMLASVFGSAYLLQYNLSFLVALTGVVSALCGLALSLPFLIYMATFWNDPKRKLSVVSKIFHVI